jgi:hypothetical protein
MDTRFSALTKLEHFVLLNVILKSPPVQYTNLVVVPRKMRQELEQLNAAQLISLRDTCARDLQIAKTKEKDNLNQLLKLRWECCCCETTNSTNNRKRELIVDSAALQTAIVVHSRIVSDISDEFVCITDLLNKH